MPLPCSRLLVPALLLSFLSPLLLMAADRLTGKMFATRSEVLARHGMAATAHPLATQIAVDILRQGGSAVDAAIAANAALGLMEPVGCGLGGDLFALVWDPATARLHGYNGSGRSPRGLTREVFAAAGLPEGPIPMVGMLPISVPGAADGWFALHARFGRLPLEQVLAPAIRYAREGFPVTELIAFYWDLSIARRRDQPGFLDTFTRDGRAPAKGEIWTNPALADTYALLAREGRDAFYRGSIARTIDAFMQAHGGYLRAEDLAAHTGEWVDPVSVNYRGYDVWELPPNGQGIAALQMLNILEGYDLASFGFGSPEHLHLLIEAKKLAYEDRARFYADPAFASIPLSGLLSKEYAAERRALLDPARAARRYDPGVPAGPDTTYLCTADASGMMVSLIQSNYGGMGCGVSIPSLGFQFQNRGNAFSFLPGHPNEYQPGKRPFHTIIPAFVTRAGQPLLAFGVMGGAMQPQGHVQILLNLLDFGMNLQEAGDAPRLHHDGSSEPTGTTMTDGGTVSFENGFSPETLRALLLRGHRIISEAGPYGGYQAIWRDPTTGVYSGASESRKDGAAAGY